MFSLWLRTVLITLTNVSQLSACFLYMLHMNLDQPRSQPWRLHSFYDGHVRCSIGNNCIGCDEEQGWGRGCWKFSNKNTLGGRLNAITYPFDTAAFQSREQSLLKDSIWMRVEQTCRTIRAWNPSSSHLCSHPAMEWLIILANKICCLNQSYVTAIWHIVMLVLI